MPRSIVFDLDNTLFLTKETTIWEQMSVKAALFISEEFQVEHEATLVEVKSAPQLYGSSVRLYTDKYGGRRLQALVDCMHNVDLSEVKGNSQLAAALGSLTAERLYLYTNGARSYANMMLSLLGIEEYFAGLFCLEDAAFVSKPSAGSFREMTRKFSLVGSSTICVDDCSGTLSIARQHGFRTAYISDLVDTEHPTYNSVLDFITFETIQYAR
ncbi:HAD family hydrolase [Pseudomonas peli]|uniref:HAD family hydrolase n=1 Tax=Pseudomonas peli TaxID=592361 RepID=UPI0024ADF43A|nr:HAD family hydrolase [Pseudomonas peli]